MLKKIKAIMLVDDDKAVNFMNKKVIKNINLTNTIYEKYNGQEAIDFLLNNPEPLPNLIFLDINMPIMDGWEFIEKFEKISSEITKNIEIIFMLTTSLNPDDKEKAKNMKLVKSLINKPLTEKKLKNLLKDRIN